jgi:hypothetical protein
MTSVKRKFAACLITLFIIPSAHYIGRATMLTPDACAEPIYEFAIQSEPTATPTPTLRHKGTATNGDRQPDVDAIRKKIFEDAKRRGVTINKLRVELKKGNDGKPFLQVSGEVSASKVSASRVKELNAQVNKYTAGNCKVESKIVNRLITQRTNSAPAR